MNYYNEHDPKAASWLRELITAGLIPPGDVDERSITEIKPHELTGYTQQHFFAGIGGWSLALGIAGWPPSRPVRTGSCPCQPFSVAGQGKGEADERHLWPVFRDLITFGEPTVTFGEQVASAAGREWLAGIRADLEGLGYEVGAADLCAASAGAPHIRQRLFWVADAHGGYSRAERKQRSREYGLQPQSGGSIGLADGAGERRGQGSENRRGSGKGTGSQGSVGRSAIHGHDCRLADSYEQGREGQPLGQLGASHQGDWSDYDILACTDGKARRVEPGSFPLAHGIPGRVGLLRGYGNAIVPQTAAEFIMACDEILPLTIKPMHADPQSLNPSIDAPGVACGDLVLRVGEWYVRPSNVGIPRHVKLMTLTACGRYCVVSYTGKSNAPKHHCLASELKPGKYKSLENAESIHPESKP